MRIESIVVPVVAAVFTACSSPAPKADAPPATSAAPTATAPAAAVRPVTPPANAPHWDYEADGPTAWGKLAPEFATCSAGQHQSPIDLHDAKRVNAAQLTTEFKPAELRVVHHEHMSDVVNTGHSIQVNSAGTDSITIGTERYALVQFHFHSPSEHHVNGKSFPAEMHLVHKAADGRLAVIGVLFEEGAENKALDPIWANLPGKKGEETHLPHVMVDADDLLPTSRESWRYDGSLTTPPCAEAVTWIVMTKPVQMSKAQLTALRAVMKPNNRPVQALHGRSLVLEPLEEVRTGN